MIVAAKKIFRSVDGDGNGKLDKDELGCLVQEMRKSMGLPYLLQVAMQKEVDEVKILTVCYYDSCSSSY